MSACERHAYPSDLKDKQWELVKGLIPKADFRHSLVLIALGLPGFGDRLSRLPLR